MTVQQVFLSYNRSGQDHAALAEIYRYCPHCGRELAARTEDARPSCHECGFVLYGNPLPDMAFEADRHIIERYFSTGLTGAPADPLYSAQG